MNRGVDLLITYRIMKLLVTILFLTGILTHQ